MLSSEAFFTLVNVVFSLLPRPLHDRDDRDRNAGGDQAVLDGGRARLVLDEALNESSSWVGSFDPHVAV